MRPWPMARRLWPVSVVLLLAAGCAGDDGAGSGNEPASPATAASTTPAPTVAPATTPPPTAPAPTTPAPTAPTTVAPTAPAPPDPAALLGTALSTLGDTYRFSGAITVNGATAATAEGDRVGTGSRFDVTANGSTVSYVVVPDGTWVRQGDAAWEQLQDPPAAVDPIDALAAPLGLTLVSADAQTAQVDVSVDPAALGVPGDAPVVVHASIQSGALASVAYESSQNGMTAQIVTTFGPAADASPVVAPA